MARSAPQVQLARMELTARPDRRVRWDQQVQPEQMELTARRERKDLLGCRV